jgi:hypothetical protein
MTADTDMIRIVDNLLEVLIAAAGLRIHGSHRHGYLVGNLISGFETTYEAGLSLGLDRDIVVDNIIVDKV